MTIDTTNMCSHLQRKFLEASDDRILTNAGSVSAEQAKEFAETEFEKYRIIQDRLFESDFDKFDLPR